MDVISQVGRHLTAQCLAHQTGEFEIHSTPNRKPVKLVQNAAACLVTGTRRSDHITPVLHQLHWLPVATLVHWSLFAIVPGRRQPVVSPMLVSDDYVPQRA